MSVAFCDGAHVPASLLEAALACVAKAGQALHAAALVIFTIHIWQFCRDPTGGPQGTIHDHVKKSLVCVN